MNKQIIKWSGSKRSQADSICNRIPNKSFETYNEPFCGSASMLIEILNRDDKNKFEKFICSDLNKDLIDLWNFIKTDPKKLMIGYDELWKEFNSSDTYHRKKFFESIREKNNLEHNPIYFMFIMRTTTNGMPRYNNKGEFNSSCHFTRPGIKPSSLYDIVLNASDILNDNNVIFNNCSYSDYKNTNIDDFFYLDPPYSSTKGMYFGNFNKTLLFDWINNNKFTYILSYDGKVEDGDDYTVDLPIDYKTHEYLKSGNSSFRRVTGNSKDSIIYESLYMNF